MLSLDWVQNCLRGCFISRYWATVGLCALTSANVVGYNSVGLRTGAKGVGACFVNVDGATMNLQDLKVTGYSVESGYTDEEVYVQTLDASGCTTASYYWYDSEDDEMYGWYDNEGVHVENIVIPAGEGLYAYAPDESYSIQSVGQVPTSDITVALRCGAKLIANSIPTSVGLHELVATGYSVEDGYVDEEVYVQTLDASGCTTASYYWYDSEDDEMYGWYDNEGVYVENIAIAPGETVYAYSPEDIFSIVLPGVTL